jgi:hypothetical protein
LGWEKPYLGLHHPIKIQISKYPLNRGVFLEKPTGVQTMKPQSAKKRLNITTPQVRGFYFAHLRSCNTFASQNLILWVESLLLEKRLEKPCKKR